MEDTPNQKLSLLHTVPSRNHMVLPSPLLPGWEVIKLLKHTTHLPGPQLPLLEELAESPLVFRRCSWEVNPEYNSHSSFHHSRDLGL